MLRVRYLIIFTFLTALVLSGCSYNLSSLYQNQDNKQIPPPAELGSFTFSVVGDNSTIGPVYQEIVRQVNDSEAQFLVNNGDVTVYGSAEEFEALKKFNRDNLQVPVYTLIGNHDYIRDSSGKTFERYFGERNFSWDFEHVHFVALDNGNPEVGFSDQTLEWLTEDLKNNSLPVTLIFMHTPINVPFASYLTGKANRIPEEGVQRFIKVIRQHHIDYIFTGDVHGFFEYTLEGTPVTITGGGGSRFLLPGEKATGEDNTYYHYLEVKVEGTNVYPQVIEIKK